MIHHPDTGCEKAKSQGYFGHCLDCPLSVCLEEEGVPNPSRSRTQIRDGRIKQEYQDGQGKVELSVKYNVTVRTIERILERLRE